MKPFEPGRPSHVLARRPRAARAIGVLALAGILALPLLGSAVVRRAEAPRPGDSRYLPNDAEHARLGMPCSAHPNVRLEWDLVRIHHSFSGSGGYDSVLFPNARMVWEGGCINSGPQFTEVAYCRECRRAYEWWLARNAWRLWR